MLRVVLRKQRVSAGAHEKLLGNRQAPPILAPRCPRTKKLTVVNFVDALRINVSLTQKRLFESENRLLDALHRSMLRSERMFGICG